MMAEYLSTYLAAEEELISHRRETQDEQDVPLETRLLVLKRDGHRCRFPGCSMRAHLGLHHIRFRSQGGGHEPENLIILCDAHHTLIHDRICSVEGRAPDQLEFKGGFLSEFPQMMKEARQRMSGVAPDDEDDKDDETVEKEAASQTENEEPPDGPPGAPKDPTDEDDYDESEDWRDETVAAIFDGPPTPRPEPPKGDPITTWVKNYARQKRKDRPIRAGRGKRAGGNGRDHVIASGGNGKSKPNQVVAVREAGRRGQNGSASRSPKGNPPP